MSTKHDRILATAAIQIQGLRQRPELEKGVPYRLDEMEAMYSKSLTLKTGNPRVTAALRIVTNSIRDLSATLRSMVNANVAYAKSVVGTNNPVLKDFAGRMRRSAGRTAPDASATPAPAPPAATVPEPTKEVA